MTTTRTRRDPRLAAMSEADRIRLYASTYGDGSVYLKTNVIAIIYGISPAKLLAIAKLRGINPSGRRGWKGASYVWTVDSAIALNPGAAK